MDGEGCNFPRDLFDRKFSVVPDSLVVLEPVERKGLLPCRSEAGHCDVFPQFEVFRK